MEQTFLYAIELEVHRKRQIFTIEVKMYRLTKVSDHEAQMTNRRNYFKSNRGTSTQSYKYDTVEVVMYRPALASDLKRSRQIVETI